jgi:hypothetical protein
MEFLKFYLIPLGVFIFWFVNVLEKHAGNVLDVKKMLLGQSCQEDTPRQGCKYGQPMTWRSIEIAEAVACNFCDDFEDQFKRQWPPTLCSSRGSQWTLRRISWWGWRCLFGIENAQGCAAENYHIFVQFEAVVQTFCKRYIEHTGRWPDMFLVRTKIGGFQPLLRL